MNPANRRRAIIVRRAGTCAPDLEVLIARHRLDVVFTIFGPSAPKLTALVTIQHILEHAADVVVIPHLTTAEIRAEDLWRAVTGLADVLTAEGTWIRL